MFLGDHEGLQSVLIAFKFNWFGVCALKTVLSMVIVRNHVLMVGNAMDMYDSSGNVAKIKTSLF